MKKSVIIGIVTFLIGALVSVGVIYKMAPGMMIHESESKYDFETSVARFESAVEEHGWKLPHVHDLQKTMDNFGKDVQSVKVFELCHPEHAAKILEKDQERIVSSMMPCRVAIYEKSDGKVYISRMNSGLMAGTMGGIVAEVMSEAAAENEEILQSILKQ